jgi:hypothetical protein
MYSTQPPLKIELLRALGAPSVVAALALLLSGCSLSHNSKLLIAGEPACGVGVSRAPGLATDNECLMQKRAAYERALGDLSVQVLR